MMLMKKCVVCHMDLTSGKAARVREDRVIRFIRKIKKTLNIARNYDLYVCEADFEKNNEKRKKYEKDIIIFTIVAVFVTVILIILPLISGTLSIPLFLSSIILGIMIVGFAVFLKYIPASDSVFEDISENKTERILSSVVQNQSENVSVVKEPLAKKSGLPKIVKSKSKKSR